MDQQVKNQGPIVQCIGAVVDVEFPRDQMPRIYDALKMDEIGLTLEVQQQLGDGVVRTIALGSSDGLRRGMQVVNTGGPIQVPVGLETLGRIMDVLGRPIDERGPVEAEKHMSIHRAAPLLDRCASFEAAKVDVDSLEYREALQVVRIEGGIANNVVPDSCSLVVNRRYAPSRSLDEAVAEVVAFCTDGGDKVPLGLGDDAG